MQEQAVASFRPSPQQEQLWLAHPDGPAGRSQAAILIDGELAADALRQAVEKTVARHEILRTTYQRQAGMRVPLQVVNDELAPAWTSVEVSGDGELVELLRVEREQDIDLESGPVLRSALATLGVDRHVLVLTLPTVSLDDGSLTTLVRDIASYYGGTPPTDEPLQYADFSEWQHELLSSADEAATKGRTYWSDRADAVSPSVPFLFTAERSIARDIRPIQIDDNLLKSIEEQSERYGVNSEVFVQAAWHLLLARLSGMDEISVGTIMSERPHGELMTALGLFVRPVPVRTNLSGESTFAELLDQIGRAREEAAGWQDYLSPSSSPALQVGYVAPGALEPLQVNGATFSLGEISTGAERFSLSLSWAAVKGSQRAQLAYDPAAFGAEHAERLARSLARLLASAAADPGTAIGQLELLDQEEREQILRGFNATASPASGSRVDDLIAAAAKAHTDRVAVVDGTGSMTYGELDTRSNQLAQRLVRAGARPGAVVGLCTDRSTEMVVAMVGILKTGAAYLPLNFEHPAARLGHQLEESEAVAVVTQERVLERLPDAGGERICLDRDRAQLDSEPDAKPDAAGTPEDLVYVIYTSGSTGTPKGVGVKHANVVNYVEDLVSRVGADAEPLAFGMVTAISTDLGNTALFPALCSGGTLVLVAPAAAADAAAFAAQNAQQPIDVLKITPSHLASLMAGPDSEVAALLPRRRLVTGGEASSWDLVARVAKLGTCEVLNHYGPTETTIGSCTFDVGNGPGAYRPATVPIGRPIRNTSCYILDSNRGPVPIGAPGELYIGGAGVASGYVGQPEATSERFLADPFADDSGRMYATGDLARWLPDGSIEFLGRRDDQLKIRGFRVEPAEIEAALRSEPSVREAVVLGRDDGRGDRRLVAYVVGDGIDEGRLKRHVAEWVPDFMVPAAFVVLDQLPRTASGKIDRLALPAPEDVVTSSQRAHVPPRNPVEEKVAAIWADVLGVDSIGVEDDFFAIGGHSLLATQIVARVRNDFAIDLPLHALFSSPTVATLSQSIVELESEEPDAETAALLDELEGLSDEEAERLLAGETGSEEGPR